MSACVCACLCAWCVRGVRAKHRHEVVVVFHPSLAHDHLCVRVCLGVWHAGM